MALADPGKSRAVLIGASRFADDRLDDLPAVRNNIIDLGACLRDPEVWGLPAAHCTVVFDPTSPNDLIDPIHAAAEEADDTLLVYYAGHGLIDHDTNELLLALVDSKSGRSHTAVRYEYVRRDVNNARARCRVVILDCCYSGRAIGGMADMTTAVADGASAEGTYVLASAPPNIQALSPPGETHTAFTGELLAALREGIAGGGELLRLDAIYKHVRFALRDKKKSYPEPQRRAGNTAGDLALARNRQWRAPATGPHRDHTPAPPTDRHGDPTVGEHTPWPPSTATRKPVVTPPGEKPPPVASAVATSRPRPRKNRPQTERERVAELREEIKQRIRQDGPTMYYPCPICQVDVMGRNMIRHFDKHTLAEVRRSGAMRTRDPGELRERLKEQLRVSGHDGRYACPVCGVHVSGTNLVKHFDGHSSVEISALKKITLVRETVAPPRRQPAPVVARPSGLAGLFPNLFKEGR